MNKNMPWHMTILVMTVAILVGAYRIIGPALGQESENSEGGGEHWTEISEAGRESGHERRGEHGSMSEGAGEAGNENVGEHGGRAGGGIEGNNGEGMEESGDPSSPILALDETWGGIVNGLRTSMAYDVARGAFSGFVENPGDQKRCFVQIELNLKQDTTTVVELGPQPVGDLAPGARMPVELLVADEPLAAGLSYDAWEIHPEVFDCGGPGPVNADDASEHGGRGGEGIEGSGGDAAEGSGTNALTKEQIYDVTRNGARLVMRYDAPNNRFVGMVVNKITATLTRVRVEIHLSNGVELGPTKATDLPPGYLLSVTIPATAQAFDTWTPHAEVGMGEHGRETAGEHGGSEGLGEHGGREDRGEHGGREGSGG